MKIQATVRKQNLTQLVESPTEITEKLDGLKIGFNLEHQLQTRDNAVKMLHHAMKDFPLNCMTVEVVDNTMKKVGMNDMRDGKFPVTITLKVRADLQAYQSFSARLCKTLDGIATNVVDFSMYSAPGDPINMTLFEPASRQYPQGKEQYLFPFSEYVRTFADLPKSGEMVIAVNTAGQNGFRNTSWKVYTVDQAHLPLLAIMASTAFGIKLELNDGIGQAVARVNLATDLLTSQNYSLPQPLRAVTVVSQNYSNAMPTFIAMRDCSFYRFTTAQNTGSRPWTQTPIVSESSVNNVLRAANNPNWRAVAFVGPMFVSNFCYVPEKIYKIDMDLTLDEIKKISNVKASVYFYGNPVPESAEKWLKNNLPANYVVPQWQRERLNNAQ